MLRAGALAAALLLAPWGSAAARDEPGALVITGATVIASPEAPALANGVVVMRGGRIESVGPRGSVSWPANAKVLDLPGRYVVAGFQNSHVHFIQPLWSGAEAAGLSVGLREMALRWGFTTVVDTGSFPEVTLALRDRIARGEVTGPRILTTGIPFYPPGGLPYYLHGVLPEAALARMNTPATAEEASAIATRQLAEGADAVKLFTGSGQGKGRVMLMPLAPARAAVEAAHRAKRIAFAHASSRAGLEVALAAKVDIVAHALDDVSEWDEALARRMVAADMAMVPTLKLFGSAFDPSAIQREVGDFARAGGQVLFGTDVGFMEDTDPTQEYVLMAGAGLGWRQVLASLTTAPAARFGESARRGRIAAGMDADLVVLATDPASDPKAFAQVVATVRGGQVVYEAASPRISVRNLPDGDVGEPRARRLDRSHMTLLGMRLDRDSLAAVTARLGDAEMVETGDHHGNAQVCYEALAGTRWLVFARRREGATSTSPISSFELHSRRPEELPCVPLRRAANAVATASGLAPGMTASQLQARLGRPTGRGDGYLVFSYLHTYRRNGMTWDELSSVTATVERERVTSLSVWTITTS